MKIVVIERRSYIVFAKFSSGYLHQLRDDRFYDQEHKWVPWEDEKLIEKYIHTSYICFGN